MTFGTPSPISSATPYPVLLVGDEAPTTAAEVAAADRFTLDIDGTDYQVCGCGRLVGGVVRFHEKDVAHSGKDIRVWTVIQHDDGSFTAEHAAAF